MTDSKPSGSKTHSDVRMRGFAERTTVESALSWLDAHAQCLESESVSLAQSADKVLAQDIVSQTDVPRFSRAMMDGYAVHATDTHGAAPYNPLALAIIGEVLPGNQFPAEVQRGQAVRIMTGAPIPQGADAVLPAEYSEAQSDRVLCHGEVATGKHVGLVGEDVARGTCILSAGRRLRPQDLGLLSSIGCQSVRVVRQPRVRIVITGNELLPPGTPPHGNRIGDANGPMLQALVNRDGGITINPGIVPDRPAEILSALRDDADIILVSGGSSVGQEDHAPSLITEHGELAIHGIAMRPSSPSGMGLLDDRLVLLLPGNPVSCLCAYDFFAGRAIRTAAGRSADWPYPFTYGRLARKLVSAIGRVDYARIAITPQGVEPLAISGASVLSSTTRADGFVIIPADSEGYAAGADVKVYHY